MKRAAAGRIALVALAIMVLACALGPLWTGYGRDAIQLEARMQPPSTAHPFGTDALGRDFLTRTLHGGRASLAVMALATAVAVVVGTGLGGAAGFAGGKLDAAISAVVDASLAVPLFFVLLVASAWWGSDVATLCIAIGLATWMPVARLVRSATRGLRERTFVAAARALGFGAPRILVRHVLPNAAATILVAAALVAAQAIVLESALGFLGVGLRPPTPSWGRMLQEAQEHGFDAPWLAVFPGACIFATVVALHVVAERGRAALDRRGGG